MLPVEILKGLIRLNKLMIGQIMKGPSLHEAIDNVQIEQPILIQIAEFARPAPSRRIESGGSGIIVKGPDRLQYIRGDLVIASEIAACIDIIGHGAQGLLTLRVAAERFHIR